MILKLIPGQRVNFTVEGVSQVDGNFGPQLKFAGQTPDDSDAILFLNVATAERQMDRLGYDAQTIVGETIEIERTEKNGTKYTNFNRSSATPAHPVIAAPRAMPQPAVKPVATSGKQPYSVGGPLPYETETGAAPEAGYEPVTTVDRFDKLLNLYDVCFEHAFALAHKKMGADCTHEGIAAQAATIFIAAKERAIGV